ncbi:MAG: late competence protein [Hymenobacter sp.]|nr:late competence protein [Hymenobacter sp.]
MNHCLLRPGWKMTLRQALRGLLIACVCWGSGRPAHAQEGTRLEIHHLNTGTGDITVMLLKNGAGAIVRSVLIDGGEKSADFNRLVRAVVGTDSFRFTYILISHFHSDHYAGMNQALSQKKEFKIQADTIIVLGGFKRNVSARNRNGTVVINPTLEEWENWARFQEVNEYILDEGRKGMKWASAPANAIPQLLTAKKEIPGSLKSLARNCQKPQVTAFKLVQPTANFHSAKGEQLKSPFLLSNAARNITLSLGTIVGDGDLRFPVRMRLAAAVGFLTYDAGATRHGAANSANDDSMVWLLECGPFRYYTGGDLGADATTGAGYGDAETPLAAMLSHNANWYATAVSPYQTPGPTDPRLNQAYRGHVCAMKVNHHGSINSNNETFLNTLAPAAAFVIGGGNASRHDINGTFLPKMDFTQGARIAPPSAVRGVYFCNQLQAGRVRRGTPSVFMDSTRFDYSAQANDYKLVLSKDDLVDAVPNPIVGAMPPVTYLPAKQSRFSVLYFPRDSQSVTLQNVGNVPTPHIQQFRCHIEP